jgi:hypothetical protein
MENNGYAVFTSGQIADYGPPEESGYLDKYLVVEEEEDAHPRISTFKVSKEYAFVKPREIHRYCRTTRFRNILKHMMGLGGFSTKKSIDILDEIAHELPINISYTPPCMIWNAIWEVLKTNKFSKYYSRIPTIIKHLNLTEYKSKNSVMVFLKVMDDFKEMDRIFNIVKDTMSRAYFPSLRFIALKLLDRHQFTLPIAIPYARTAVKVDRLEHDYDVFWNKLRELEAEGLKDFFEF